MTEYSSKYTKEQPELSQNIFGSYAVYFCINYFYAHLLPKNACLFLKLRLYFISKSRLCFLFLKLRIEGAFGMRLCFFVSFLFFKVRFCFILTDKFWVFLFCFFRKWYSSLIPDWDFPYFKADDIVFISIFHFEIDIVCAFVCTLRLRFWFISKLRFCFISKITFLFSIEVGPHWPP